MKKSKASDIALKIENVSKSFRLPTEKASGIKQAFINRMRGVKGYTKQQVLKDISFEVKKGDFFGIVGRNGSGKSTLLKLISQIYTPDSGKITVNGSLVPFIELGVGFNPELTGRENVYLNGAMLGFSKEEIDEMYDDIVDFAELHDFMDQKLKNYSSGMQVRLAFSVAIKAQGDILVLDEVLAVGDEAFQKKCNEFFELVKKDKSKTIILVTHSMDSVRRYCSKAIMIDGGKMVTSGDKDEVADEYSKQFLKETNTVIKEKNRYGTGEVIYENIKHTLTKKYFILDFDVLNKTDNKYKDLTMGFDFCINNDIILGNDTRFIDKYARGISLDPQERRHFCVRFENNFGNYDFTLNMNMTTKLGLNVVDHIRPVLDFSSNNVRYSKAFKVLSLPDIKEI